MIRSLLKLGLLLVVGILVYNYFLGTDAEKDQSRAVFKQVGGLAKSVGALVKSERDKFNEGKYDEALTKLGDVYQGVKKQAKYLDENVVKRLEAAETRRKELEKELDDLGAEPVAEPPADPKPTKKGIAKTKTDETTAAKSADLARKREKLQRELEALQKDFEQITSDAEKNLE